MSVGAAACGLPAAATRTARNCSWAALSTSLMVSGCLPGSDTTMFLLPWVFTSASETPDPFTRCRMIFTASLIVVWVIEPVFPRPAPG